MNYDVNPCNSYTFLINTYLSIFFLLFFLRRSIVIQKKVRTFAAQFAQGNNLCQETKYKKQ